MGPRESSSIDFGMLRQDFPGSVRRSVVDKHHLEGSEVLDEDAFERKLYVARKRAEAEIAHSEIEVDGVKGNLTVVKKQHMRSPAFNLVWIRDGVLYCLMGKGTRDEAIEIASLMR